MEQPVFRALAETTPAAIFVQREDRLLYVNPAAEGITGYGRDELLAMEVWQLLPPEERERARAVYAARLRGEAVDVPPRREQRLIAKSGAVRWVDVSIGRIDWDGKPALLGTAFDVSDRRQAEAQRSRGEQRFRALVEHASDVVLVFDAQRLITYVGPSLERILGHPPSALQDHDLYDLIHPDDLDVCRAAVDRLLSAFGTTVRIQYRVRHADGAWRWMEGIGANLLDEPAIAGVVVNARDVTAWRAAEDQLSESEARFALAIDGAKDGIWDLQLASGEFFVSPRMREMLGAGPDDAISVPQLFAERIHPDDYSRLEDGWRAHLDGSATHYEAEYRYRLPDGTYRWLLARARTVRDAAGAPQRMVGSLTDTTARKAAEEDARQRQAELAHVLRVAAMNEMAASIAHELNQPLAAIVNYARGCALRLGPSDAAAEVLEALERIAAEALRASEVVHSLKRVIRKEPPREAAIDLAALAHEAVQLVHTEATDRGIGMRFDAARGLRPVWGDRTQLQQVVLNLLRNAIEAIAQLPGLVELRIAPLGEGLRLSVSDSGAGVPPRLLEHIFMPFFTTKSSGLGMGLSISRTIVEAHGGRLWAEANPSGGATFSFTLPLRPA
ncbi:MAG TPA: PAS domain S-box protein [Candidatus Dormibacteraeota bacterium]|nr:PAS domain S-box protein [Candidatus Dormibacteraeota bacterium]